MTRMQHDHLVQDLPAAAADPALRDSFLLRTLSGDCDGLDAHGSHAAHDRGVEDGISVQVGGRPVFLPRFDFHRQNMRNPAWCQRTTVSGFTMMSVCFHLDQELLVNIQLKTMILKALDFVAKGLHNIDDHLMICCLEIIEYDHGYCWPFKVVSATTWKRQITAGVSIRLEVPPAPKNREVVATDVNATGSDFSDQQITASWLSTVS